MRRIIGNILRYFLSAADGERITVVLGDEVRRGGLDGPMRDRYDLNPRTGRR